MNNQVIVIFGPTGTGKSTLAIKIASTLDSPVISADSRKVYKGLDIGTNKEALLKAKHKKLIPSLHLIDVVTPDKRFTVYDFLKECEHVFAKAHAAGKIPVVVGGTVMYITALLKGYTLRETKPNIKKRIRLEKKALPQLQLILKTKRPDVWENMDNGERNNKRRLVRWLEVALDNRKVTEQKNIAYDFITIPLIPTKEETQKKLQVRVEKMLDAGLIEETKRLLQKYPKDCVGLSTMGYKEAVDFINGDIPLTELKERIIIRHRQYARYQRRWIMKKLHTPP
ncbi:tRNA (adenosine(37)-N6)-dimethylallyltransferase MiaA [Candidatus Dojkabacteria bacterium]|nr:tRNA (adenosine(37)-N6)-dimethylallyltransferase MiaA [Candidatus Dojkabacteria bacterium]